MSDSNSNEPVETGIDDDISLDDFEKEFYGQGTPQKEEPVEELNEPEEQTEPEETEEEFEPEPEPEPVKKKSKFQERIDELSHKARTEREEKEALQRRLDEVLSKLEEKAPKQPEKAAQPDDGKPNHSAVHENGDPVYPLGEFDPAYIEDLANFKVAQKFAEFQAKQENDRRIAEQRQAEETLAKSWNERLENTRETYPDFLEKAASLNETLGNVPPEFGDYLATTIMGMEYGPDVLYHLANNPAEAKRLAMSNPAQATLALGRLEARFALLAEDKQEQKLKVSKAPEPPKRLNKGTAVVKEIPDDTDDLDAFEQKFFAAKRRF